LCTWTISCVTMVARWPMNLPIWILTAFPTHLIRQTWIRETFVYLECWSIKSRIGCFRRLKTLWLFFTRYRMSWSWTTCSPSSSIGLNVLNGSVSMGRIRYELTLKYYLSLYRGSKKFPAPQRYRDMIKINLIF
jgi:hypothetical protein